jgi:hypothetical protein
MLAARPGAALAVAAPQAGRERPGVGIDAHGTQAAVRSRGEQAGGTMRAWEYLEIAYAPGKPTVDTSEGLRYQTIDLLVPEEFGWASVSLTLNELGAEGWELVGTVQELGVTKLFLKREITTDMPEVYRADGE